MLMNIQIFGINKSRDTQKAIRFFKERGIKYHFVDLNERAISKGELNNISNQFTLEDLIDKEGKEFRKLKLEYMVYDIQEKLLEYPKLFKMPIVRDGKEVTIGYFPEIWKKWIDENNS